MSRTGGRPLSAEDELLAWLRRRADPRGELIGDDAALLEATGDLAVSVDQQIAGVHFVADLDPRLVARRLVRVNLSDLAATGAAPAYALLALALPEGFPARDLLAACVAECERWKLRLAGGDLARHQLLSASLTVIGRLPSRGGLRRDAARPGDSLWLGGVVGLSGLGRALVAAGARRQGRRVQLPATLDLPRSAEAVARRAVNRHLLPEPQLELGRQLARRSRVAAIDVSDGLALDLHRLCRASGVGARLDATALPAVPGQAALARHLGLAPLELALAGGEDYVLLFTLPPRSRGPRGTYRIGVVTAGNAVEITIDGAPRPLAAAGWDHLDDGERRAV